MAAALLLFPATANAASVTVQPEGGAAKTLNLANLQKDVDRDYMVRSVAGGEQPVRVNGTSLNVLLGAADADLIGVGSVEISGAGRTVILSPEQLGGGGAGSPVVFEEGGQASFLRPEQNSQDANGDDKLTAPTLRVRLLKSPTLEVEAKASNAAVKVGEAVTFTASGRGGAGQELIYRWTFGDNSRRLSGTRVVHRFRETGIYNVSVGLTTKDNETGTTGIIRVRVGPPPKGPDRQGGGTNDDANAPSSGTAAGGDSGVSGGTGQADSGPARTPAPDASPRRRQRAPQKEPSGGRTVEGVLLADASGTPPPEAARKRAARTGNDREDDGGFRIPGLVWGVLITLGLAGAGAVIELRSVLPRPWKTA